MKKRLLPKQGIYISLKGHSYAQGGGANTFSWNFNSYLKKYGMPRSGNLLTAAKAIVIADKVNLFLLWLAKCTGCFIVHRLDEHFQENESKVRKKKHNRIKKINKLADITVFQSEFVKNNVLPHLNAKKHAVILNGADPEIFFDRHAPRDYIGHVTNSVGDKKRLDLLDDTIGRYPQEKFLLVGNHNKSPIRFDRHSNVTMIEAVPRQELADYYRKMKCLYFPSENDPCPNTVVEAVMCGVPVCYNPLGGTKEIVQDCGLPLDQFDVLLRKSHEFRSRCAKREDLYFKRVIQCYFSLLEERLFS